jgi:hypothetical protein
MVGRVTPNSAPIWATVQRRLPSGPVSSYISRAMRAWRAVSSGFCPPCAAPRPGGGQPVHGPLGHQSVLGNRAKDLKEHPPYRGVDALAEHHQGPRRAPAGPWTE